MQRKLIYLGPSLASFTPLLQAPWILCTVVDTSSPDLVDRFFFLYKCMLMLSDLWSVKADLVLESSGINLQNFKLCNIMLQNLGDGMDR